MAQLFVALYLPHAPLAPRPLRRISHLCVRIVSILIDRGSAEADHDVVPG